MPAAPIVAEQTIVKGDDYRATDGRALSWSSPSWPNIAGASLEMVSGHLDSQVYANLPVVWRGTIPGSPETHVAHLELTHAQTSEAFEGCFDYLLRAALPNGDLVTLATGRLTVLAQPGQAAFMP